METGPYQRVKTHSSPVYSLWLLHHSIVQGDDPGRTLQDVRQDGTHKRKFWSMPLLW
uniref:Uncharacterized protein n=1 Tax=Arundo donax TaxID=35708 RepID=A0A0A9E387_ARUDO